MALRRRASLGLALALLIAILPASAALAAQMDVEIAAFEYRPSELDVAVGDTVTWTNTDPEPHTVTSLPDATEQFDATLAPGESFSFTFGEDGFNPYFCEFHPNMRGDVLVGDTARPDPLDTTPVQAVDARGASVAYSQRAFPDGNAGGTALIGRDDLFADSLSSGGVQGAVDAPLLLTDSAALDQRVADELERLAVADVWILGGRAAVSADVANALEAAGYQVSRIEGPTRLETAVDAAMTALPEATGAILARAYAAEDPTQAFADSLSAGALAAVTGQPVLLSETDRLSTATAAYFEASAVETVTVVGGEAAVSAEVVADLEALGLGVERLAGSNRVETAAMVAAATAMASGPLPKAAVVIDGQSDRAWAAGFPAAVLGLPVILADGDQLPAPSAAFMVQLGSLGMPPLCGPFLSATPCGYAQAAASSPPFPGGHVLLGVLEGQNEVNEAGEPGQGDPDHTGASTVYPTSSDTALCYDYSTMIPVTAAHIHAAPAGQVGGVVMPLDVAPGPFGTPAGCTFAAEAGLVADILANPGGYYVNLHNEEYPDGAIRGQLFEPTFLAAGELSGAQEVPGPGEGGQAGGFAGVVGRSGTEFCVFMFLGPLGSSVTGAHLHQAPAGEAGPVVQPLRTPLAPGETYSCYTVDAALVTELQTNASAYYLNVHTEDFPDGAIRGQLGNF